VPIEALNWRVTVAGPDPAGGDPRALGAGNLGNRAAVKGARRAFFAEAGGFVDTPVYDRYALAAGFAFEGPAIVEERESTAVIGPGARCRIDDGLAINVDVPV
jgi:N-methylhydantoinase A/oxoprolinase/acetone carboxylase beta subunit